MISIFVEPQHKHQQAIFKRANEIFFSIKNSKNHKELDKNMKWRSFIVYSQVVWEKDKFSLFLKWKEALPQGSKNKRAKWYQWF